MHTEKIVVFGAYFSFLPLITYFKNNGICSIAYLKKRKFESIIFRKISINKIIFLIAADDFYILESILQRKNDYFSIKKSCI